MIPLASTSTHTTHTIPITDDRLKLYWNGLTYKTSDNKKLISRNKTNVKTIINDLNGEITSGELTGILGPSGSGKTTLIECLAGRRVAGLSGRVWVKSSNDNPQIRFSSQEKRTKGYDFFDVNHENYRSHNNNTCAHTYANSEQREPLASGKNYQSHDLTVHNMLEVFGLLGCARVKTSSISGGQKKRLSIALELIFSPNILLLDEPTTGLDSTSSFQCLSLLKTLSYNKEPLVIAVSIHQPTARLLALFNFIYVLSMDGRCIYSGPTDRLITHLSGFGYNCPLMMYSDVKVGQLGGGECADRESVLARLSEFGNREGTERFRALQQNSSYILSNILFIHAVNIGPTLMTFTVELNIFVKEHFNKWYTCWSYFTARSLVDIPIVLILTIMFSTIMWWITGQKKRLSIALELIFSPNILLLDEPTTGLDSASSFQCLSLLKTLSYNKEPLVIAMSIHQPTARLLAFFDSIYVLSMDGRCIYSGPTDRLITHLSDFGFNCPVFHNPADFLMEISSGAHEPDAIDRLAIYESQSHTLESIKLSKPDTIIDVGKGIKNKPTTKSHRTVKDQLRDVWILLKRAHLVFIRNPFMIWLRGELDTGCLNSESVMVKIMSIVDNKSTTNETFNNLSDVGYIISTMLFIHFTAIVPTLMTFPIELNTFVKVWDGWRFSVHQLVMMLLALVSHSLGLLLSAIFMNDIRASILSLTTIVTALLLFSGSLIPVRILPSYLQTLSYLSIFRLTYESMLIILYGFNRCPTLNDPLTMDSLTHEFGVNMYHMEECLKGADSLANVTRNSLSGINRLVAKQNPSRILEWFDLQDRDLYVYISLFLAYTVTLRWLAYYALKWRARIE
ncbi:unnamed protein product [Oppiella nova]|uniref:ABC transporter domain-containing protein n=1 Tax=Oppiella nova TaxID=334625 RepID=A0A7R9M7U3_9ACAR|nr:unnamed protein product [Oppiella nova]CAG2171083.1 unnamed protein product [Oppiella nova]